MNGHRQMNEPLIQQSQREQHATHTAHTADDDLSKQRFPPDDNVGFWSIVWFNWAWPMLQRAHKTGALTPTDVYSVPDYLKAGTYIESFEQIYFKLKLRGTSSRSLLFRAMIQTFRRKYLILLWFMRCIFLALTIIRPVILRQLLVNVSLVYSVPLRPDQQFDVLGLKFATFSVIAEPLYWALSLVIISFLIAMLNHHFWFIAVQMALSVRGALIGLVYRKALRLHGRHRSEYPSGRVTNLTSVDADSVMNSCWGAIHECWSSPVLITLLVIGLLIELGPSALVGVGSLILSLSCTSLLAKRLSLLQDQIMRKSDTRVSKISEALTAIKLIKLYSWQFAFSQSIQQTREEQQKLLYRSNSIGAITRVLGLASPLFVSFSSFFVYIYTGNELDATTTFTSLLLFQQLKEPLGKLPEAVNSIVKANIGLQRIQAFMDCTNKENLTQTHHIPGTIVIQNGSFDWGDSYTSAQSQPTSGVSHHLSTPVAVNSPHPSLPFSAELVGQRLESAVSEESVQLSSITIDHGVVSRSEPVLKSINLTIEPGSLTMIVGSVGAGKSSLISCLLGEMHALSGSVSISSNVAYVSQLAFLHSATVRDNILFGRPYEQDLYAQTLASCDFNEDLGQFPEGDLTVVGENGISLSGGQRSRLALARAVYSRADIYLFDEPLSAVDARVALHLFNRIIAHGGVLSGKTRVLVTHQLQFAPRVDTVIVMENGQIQHRGSYNELRALGLDFRAIVTEAHTGTKHHDRAVSPRLDPRVASPRLRGYMPTSPNLVPRLSSTPRALTPRSISAASDLPLGDLSLDDTFQQIDHEVDNSTVTIVHSSTTGQRDLTDESLSAVGMRRDIYLSYFHAGASNFIWIVVATLVIASQAGVVLSDYLLAWTNDKDSRDDQKRFLIYYLLAIVAATVLLLMRSISLAVITTKASSSLHHRMVNGLLRARQSFHDTTPIGRIINRVGKDIDLLDTQMPGVVQDIASCSIAVIGTLVLTVTVVPLSIPLLLVIFGLYTVIQRHYRPASVAMKRLESVSRSPIYQQVGSTFTGLLTLRAFRNMGSLQREYAELVHRVDLNTRIYFMLFAVHRWMGVRLEALGCLLVLSGAVVSLVLLPQLSSGLIGLVITVSLSLSGQLHWFVRQRTEFEVQLSGVERILEFSSLTPEENDDRFEAGYRYERQKSLVPKSGPNQSHSSNEYTALEMSTQQSQTPRSQDKRDQSVSFDPHSKQMIIPPPSWPARGEIVWKDVSIAYREDTQPVLHHLSAHIKGGEKIGIVGRSGSSKSTWSLALFRLMEARSGAIFIDDIPIHRVPLHILRSKLSLIPQDAILFATSVRNNLDPFHRATDAEVHRVLEQVALHDVVASMGGINAQVSDSGENLSVGQRQLLCLARALLRKSKILVMDEASASLDLHADMAMKKVISENFNHCTIITIAHRLNSVLGSDRIMVMDAGKLVEFDTPSTLIARGGFLARLLKDANAMTQEMREDVDKPPADDTKEGPESSHATPHTINTVD